MASFDITFAHAKFLLNLYRKDGSSFKGVLDFSQLVDINHMWLMTVRVLIMPFLRTYWHRAIF